MLGPQHSGPKHGVFPSWAAPQGVRGGSQELLWSALLASLDNRRQAQGMRGTGTSQCFLRAEHGVKYFTTALRGGCYYSPCFRVRN